MAKFYNPLVIALVIKRRTHKAHITDRGAEKPTGPKLPDFTLSPIGTKVSVLSNLRISGCQLKATILYHLFCCLRQFLPLYWHFSEQTVLTLSSDTEGAAF